MKSRTLSATALILLTPLVVLAFQAQADQVRKGELKSRSFAAGPLKITIVKFGHGPLSSLSFTGRPPNRLAHCVHPIQIVVENTSGEFTTFEPRWLSFVDKANEQSDVRGLISHEDQGRGGRGLTPAENRRIAPKASINDWYDLTSRVRLPARLFYKEKLLATIIE